MYKFLFFKSDNFNVSIATRKYVVTIIQVKLLRANNTTQMRIITDIHVQ